MRWSLPVVLVLYLAWGLPGCTFDAGGLSTDTVSTRFDSSVDAPSDQRARDGLGDLLKSDLGPDIYDPTDLAISPPDTSQDAGGLLFVPSNLSGSYWALGQTDLVLSGKVVVDTTAGKLTSGSLPKGVGLYCTKEYCVITAKKLTLNKGSELRVVGKRPLIVVATDDISIDGIVNVAASGLSAGPGGYLGGSSDNPGQGCGGGYKSEKRQGGAGGSFGGYGGGGGNGPLGKSPCVDTCTVGHCPAIKCLTPLQGGAGGAGGGGNGILGDGGRGGAGGGAVQLSSLKSISIKKSGVINAGGGGAQGGGTWQGGGGGAGSGGGILLEAKDITIDGIVAANGGGGGGGAIIVSGGSPGSAGAASGTAVSGGGGGSFVIDKGGKGGPGSSKADHNGGLGDKGSGVSYAHGGGGGSAGRVCIRTAGTLNPGTGATVSPFSALNSEAYNLLTLP
jgi:hypothetical protein